MVLYRYEKKHNSVKRSFLSFFSYGLILVGSLFLFWSFYPIISYEIYSYLFIQNKVFSPLPSQTKNLAYVKAQSITNNQNIFSTNLADYTKATSWFPKIDSVAGATQDSPAVSEYLLTIPKLNITDAKVIVGGEDLSNAMVHYLPNKMPGVNGVVSIFGHSTHPSLYRPDGKDKYKSIFTYLPTLDKGDTVIITISGKKYSYEVFDKFEVKPDAVNVLDQRFDDAYLNLITCVPVGQTARRLILQARLVKSDQL